MGNTPYKIKRNVSSKIPYTIKAEGYRDAKVYVTTVTNSKYEFLDVLGFGIPLYIDAINGGLKEFKEKSLKVTLYKKYTSTEGSFVLKDVKWNIREGEHLGFTLNKIKFQGSKFKSLDLFSNIVSEEGKGRFEVLNFKKGYLNYEFETKNKVYGYPEVSKLIFSKKGSIYECQAQIKWNFHKNDSLLLSVSKTYVYRDKKSQINSLLYGLLTESWFAIQENDELIEELKSKSISKSYINNFRDTLEINSKQYKIEGKRSQKMAQATKAVVTVRTDEGFGSGFFISADGYLITNYHVVGDNKEVTITTADNKQYVAKVIRGNEEADLCLLKTENTNNLPYLPIGQSVNFSVGDEVYAIGTPEDLKLSQTLTRGIVSAIRKDDNGREFLQSDVSINSGNSGGPLLNEEAEVIGINTSKVKKEGVQGLSFSIPVKQIFQHLLIKPIK